MEERQGGMSEVWTLNNMAETYTETCHFDVSAHLLSLKHGTVGGERRAGFVVEFTVTVKEGGPQVPNEAQVHPIQTCCRALSLTSTHTH